jgi:hypothetical protein
MKKYNYVAVPEIGEPRKLYNLAEFDNAVQILAEIRTSPLRGFAWNVYPNTNLYMRDWCRAGFNLERGKHNRDTGWVFEEFDFLVRGMPDDIKNLDGEKVDVGDGEDYTVTIYPSAKRAKAWHTERCVGYISNSKKEKFYIVVYLVY